MADGRRSASQKSVQEEDAIEKSELSLPAFTEVAEAEEEDYTSANLTNLMSNAHPSGEWVGYYMYQGLAKKCPMHLTLHFDHNKISGAGIDGPGQFVIIGTYDETDSPVKFTKQYIGKHAVEYEGRFQEDEIVGGWSLTQGERILTGEMRLWPLPDALYRDDESLQSILEREIQRKS